MSAPDPTPDPTPDPSPLPSTGTLAEPVAEPVVESKDNASEVPPAASCEACEVRGEDEVVITFEPLSLDRAVKHVTHPGAGAISTFIGTTRDNFAGKEVLRLEYEAYTAMAVKVMFEVINEARNLPPTTPGKPSDLKHVALYHRLGVVPVCESSVIIAVSSAHRDAAMTASTYIINVLKERVPIWKKEILAPTAPGEKETGIWKANAEWKGGGASAPSS